MAEPALIYLDRDNRPARLHEFKRVADRLADELGVPAHPAHTGEQLLKLASRYDDDSVNHLIIVCHGWTTKLLMSRAGIHVTAHRPPAVVSLAAFTEAWAPRLTRDCNISLCACMCSRSPSWYLRRLFEKVPSYWSPHSHADGGAVSFAAQLRNRLCILGVHACVRGHTTPGHVTRNPTGREHGSTFCSIGQSLFNTVLEPLGVKPTWRTCRRFNNLVKGRFAQRWILFDTAVVVELRDEWISRYGRRHQ